MVRPRVRTAEGARRALALLACAFLVGAAAWAQPAAPTPQPYELGPAAAQALPSDADWTRDAAARGRLFDLVRERVREAYFDPERVDWEAWTARHRDAVAEAAGRPALDAAFRRAFAGLGDGHSRWVGRERPPVVADGAEPAPAVELGVRAEPLDGRGLLLVRVHPGGPAHRAGLARGDVVVGVDGLSLAEPGLGWAMQDRIAAALRTGAARLEVERPGDQALRVEVAAAPVPPGASERPVGTLDGRTGVARLDVPSFAVGTAEAVHAEVARLRDAGARAVVLDLRGNPGGSVVEMGLVLGLVFRGDAMEAWTNGAPDWSLTVTADPVLIARLERRTGIYAGRDVAAARLERSTTWSGPVAVLVDGGTASAAEALAAVVARELGAPVVGEPTPGNIETVRRLSFPGGNVAWVAVGELRHPGGEDLAPIPIAATAILDPDALARGFDAPLAEATRRLLDLPVTPGRWF
jgi:carboxyl-terminal processing protease